MNTFYARRILNLASIFFCCCPFMHRLWSTTYHLLALKGHLEGEKEAFKGTWSQTLSFFIKGHMFYSVEDLEDLIDI